MHDLVKAMTSAASGMRSQSARLRVIGENVANADTPGYHRKTMDFRTHVVREGAAQVLPGRIRLDQGPARESYEPGHPLADGRGIVTYSNVDPLIEIADAREAQRSYSGQSHRSSIRRAACTARCSICCAASISAPLKPRQPAEFGRDRWISSRASPPSLYDSARNSRRSRPAPPRPEEKADRAESFSETLARGGGRRSPRHRRSGARTWPPDAVCRPRAMCNPSSRRSPRRELALADRRFRARPGGRGLSGSAADAGLRPAAWISRRPSSG